MTITVPTVYTDVTLEAFMVDALGDVATALGIVASDLDEAVINTLMAYGETLVANCTDMAKIRAISRVEAWKVAAKNVAADYNFSEGNASYSRSQMHDMIAKELAQAIQDAAGYISGYSIETGTMTWKQDPYSRFNWADL